MLRVLSPKPRKGTDVPWPAWSRQLCLLGAAPRTPAEPHSLQGKRWLPARGHHSSHAEAAGWTTGKLSQSEGGESRPSLPPDIQQPQSPGTGLLLPSQALGKSMELREKRARCCIHLPSPLPMAAQKSAPGEGLRHPRCWAPRGHTNNSRGPAHTFLLSRRNTNLKIKAGRQFMRSTLSALKLERAVNSHGTSRFTHFGWSCKLNIKHTFLSNHISPKEGWGLPVYFFLIWFSILTSGRKAGCISHFIFLVLFDWLWYCFSNTTKKTIMKKKNL